MSARARILGTTALVAAVVATGACSGATARSEEEITAQDTVLDLLATTRMSSYSQHVDDFARGAAEWSGGLDLIAVEEGRGGDDLGRLTLRVLVPEEPSGGGLQIDLDSHAWDPGPYCFDVELGPWGKRGEPGTTEGVTLVDCPEGAVAITPEPPERDVVATNAVEAAHLVLAAMPATDPPEADLIAAEVASLLVPVTEQNAHTAQPKVAVDGDDIGIAMGGPDDCVLVARIDGEIRDVHAPRVYLQPGELGCAGSTALVEDLRPPH